MDAFCDLEPIAAPNYNYSISLEEAAAATCEEAGSGGVGGAEGGGGEGRGGEGDGGGEGGSFPHQLLLRTSVLLTSLARILPDTPAIKQAMNEIVADVRVAMRHNYEAGFASGFQLGLGQKHTTTTNPRVA